MGIPMVILILLVVIGVFVAKIYNGLVKLRQNVKNGWSQIDVQLKRRHDLVPNLVEACKGFMAHEKETLEGVIKARQQAIDVSKIKDRVAAENLLSGALKSLFAVSENYPNIKADRQMMQLQEELGSTENKIAFARQYYNDEVKRMNVAVETFPDTFVASMFNFQKEEFFEIEDEGDREVPEVKF